MLDTKKITAIENFEAATEIIIRLTDADNLPARQTVSLQTAEVQLKFTKQLPSKYDKLTYDFSYLIESGKEAYRLYGSKVAGDLRISDLDEIYRDLNAFRNYFHDDFDTKEAEVIAERIRALSELLG